MAPKLSDERRRRVPALSPAAWLLVAVAFAFVVFAVVELLNRDSRNGLPEGAVPVPQQLVPGVPKGSEGARSQRAFDPLAFNAADTSDLERRATAGYAQPLYTVTDGGAVIGAQRTARWRGAIEKAVKGSGFDADVVEALVFLESSGRPEVIAGGDPANASGLTQILAETGKTQLGMRVDLAASRSLTRRIYKLDRRGRSASADRLRARRRRVDERFDPAKALAATVRYLTAARARFGREDLAVVAYHMGFGNLERAIRDYSGDTTTPVREIVARDKLSYAKLFFDSSPLRHADTYRFLNALGDDSITYYWRILAAREIVRMARSDPERLQTLQDLHDNKGSSEEVLHPAGSTQRFAQPGDVQKAIDDGTLEHVPSTGTRKLGFVVDPQLGQQARRLGRKPSLYRALRPEALSLLIYMGAGVRAIDPGARPLRVTSAVRDQRYQDLLLQTNPEATAAYSLHTTGFTFDILRRYRDRRAAEAFQFMLDRLQALDLIAWVREPASIHVTVSSDASKLEGLLRRLPGG